MKTSYIILIVAAVIVLILIGVYVVKLMLKERLYILYDENYNAHFKLKLNEKALDDLTNINEVTYFKDLSKFQRDYFYLVVELVISALSHNTDFSTKLKKLSYGMIDSSKEYISLILKEYPEFAEHWMKVDDYQYSLHQEEFSQKLSSYISELKSNIIDGTYSDVQRNKWMVLDYDNVKDKFAVMFKVKPTKIDLLFDDEKSYNDCINCLLKFYDNKDNVKYENIGRAEESMEKQRKLIRIFLRFLLIDFPIYLFGK